MENDTIKLTWDELCVINLSLIKHDILIRWGQLPKLVSFTSEQFDCLISKIDKMEKIAWLQEQRK